MSRHAAVHLICAGLVWFGLAASADEARVEAELQALAAKVERFSVVPLPTGPRRVALTPDRPPQPYPPKMTDAYPPGEAPYVARDIKPFRFRYFNNEFSYGGWHNWAMCDYASTHGFNILYPYNHSPTDWTHVPAGTQWLKWGGFVNWDQWLDRHKIPPLRYDMLTSLDLVQALVEAGIFKHDPGFQSLMIDLEHPRLSLEKLRQQPWYPHDAGEPERRAFEQKYYDGYAMTYTAPVRAARREGWRNISVYGWQPFGRTWFGLEKVELDPATDWAWNAFGRAIYQAVDILNPSVYCFYWSPQNVAYTLANIDLNMKLVRTMPDRKPVRPYYWTLLHGGGGGWRWWKSQPQRNEDVRAMIALCFFTGCDGLVLWNWSGTGNHHRPPPLKADADVMVGRSFTLKPEGAGEDAAPVVFQRYDALHILSADEGEPVKFQRIQKQNPRGKYGITPDQPVYAMSRQELASHLRPSSEPVSALIEGLALVKPFEYLLRHGEVKVDVSAQEQFAQTLPLVRRVKLGRYQILATYDPGWAGEKAGRRIVLPDFDGHRGLTLVLPADAHTRLFVLREP